MKLNQLKAGAVISYANLLIGNIIPFVYTPIMLRMLGQAEYGLYSVAQSIMGYIGLLNFGIGGTIVRYLSKYRAEGNEEGEERVAGLFFAIYSVICVLILIVGGLLTANIHVYGNALSDQELRTLQVLVGLMTLNTAVFLPFSVFSSIILAHERFVISKGVGAISGIVAPLLNLFMLYCGFGSVGLVISSTILNLITYCIYILYVIKTLRIRPRFGKTDKGILREIICFSGFVFLASIVDILYWATDKLIIGWCIGATATAVYSIGASFNGYITSLSTAVSGLLLPRLTEMAVKDVPKEEYTKLFIKVGRVQFILISLIVSGFVVFGRQFIILWAGPDYEEAYVIALLTMIPVTVPLIQNTGLNILYALNKHKFRSVVYLCVAIANVFLTLLWVDEYGILGAAMATCLAYIVGNIVIINWYYYRHIGIDIPLFWKNIFRMSPVMLGMGVLGWLAVAYVDDTTWLVFLLSIAVYTVLYAALAFYIMMNDYERALIRGPILKLKRKVSRRG